MEPMNVPPSLVSPAHDVDPKPWGSKVARNNHSSRGPGNEAMYTPRSATELVTSGWL